MEVNGVRIDDLLRARQAVPAELHQLIKVLFKKCGGGERVRTDDLLRARQALSQLSYTPHFFNKHGGPRWT